MIGNLRLTVNISAALTTLALTTALPAAWADDEEDEIPFAVADVYAELNDTDGDLGFHALVDGEPWKKLEIENPDGRKLLKVNVKGRLRRQGLTELFFESAEPPFDELTPEEFFHRFPEGDYEIEGKTLEGDELESVDLFRHVMPAQPGLQGDGSVMFEVGDAIDTVIKEKCDVDDPAYDPTEVSGDTITIAWGPVETSHPTIGAAGDVVVALYQVVVSAELEVDGKDFESVFSVDLPPTVTSMTVPAEFIALSDEFKYEVLVKEATGGNQTAVESCFVIAKMTI